MEKYAYLEIHYSHPIWKEDMALFLSEKGFYYTGYDDCIINWGDNFEIMLNKIMSGEKVELQILDL